MRHKSAHRQYPRDRDDYERRDAYRDHGHHDESGEWPRRRGFRRRHRHLFAWVVVAGGALVLGLVVLALLQATGLMSWLQSAYFTATAWVLPDDWEAGFQALPGWVHAVAGVGVIAVVAGMASELTEVFD